MDSGTGKGPRETVSRLMVARLNRVENAPITVNKNTQGTVGDVYGAETKQSLYKSVDYYRVREEMNPLPDPLILKPLDSGQSDSAEARI